MDLTVVYQLMHEFGGCVALAMLLLYLHRENLLKSKAVHDDLKTEILRLYHRPARKE